MQALCSKDIIKMNICRMYFSCSKEMKWIAEKLIERRTLKCDLAKTYLRRLDIKYHLLCYVKFRSQKNTAVFEIIKL